MEIKYKIESHWTGSYFKFLFHTFVPNNLFGQLLDISPKKIMF